MKKNKVLFFISRFAAPAALILCGIILVFSPDTGSYLGAKLLSWGLLLGGLFYGFIALAGSVERGKNAFLAVGLLAVGSWLGKNPMGLAVGFGRAVGILMIVGAVGGFFRSNYSGGKAIYLVVGVLGLLLTAVPMTASRTIFILIGLGLLIAGIAMLVKRLRDDRYLDSGDDPNIIDAL